MEQYIGMVTRIMMAAILGLAYAQNAWAQTAPEPAGSEATASAQELPLAGYSNGKFYVRSRDNEQQLQFSGRMQIDQYNYSTADAADLGLRSTFLLKRLNFELAGQLAPRVLFTFQADIGASGLDAAQRAPVRAVASILYIDYAVAPEFHIQLGQILAPFTLENRSSSKKKTFIENGIVTRLGVPSALEIGAMAWGEVANKALVYEVGLWNGDGENRLNPDNRFDGIGRVWSKPLAVSSGPAADLADLQVGASFRYGSRKADSVHYDDAALTTQGGFSFWRPTYNGLDGVNYIIPSGDLWAGAGELRIPVGWFDLTSELVYVNRGTREARATMQATTTDRRGTFKGLGYYLQVGAWLLGPRDIEGAPGVLRVSTVNPSQVEKPHANVLQIVARLELLRAQYESAGRSGAVDAQNIDGDIDVNAFLVGASYWATQHVRASVNYCLYDILVPSPSPDTSEARSLHELLFRVQVGF
jgi:phosphate-selective porin